MAMKMAGVISSLPLSVDIYIFGGMLVMPTWVQSMALMALGNPAIS